MRVKRGFMNESDQSKINGKLIQAARTDRGWTQTELSRKVGTNQQTIDKIEAGITKQSSFLPKIASVLEMDLKRLIPDIASAEAEPRSLLPEREVRGDVEDLPVHVATEGGPGEIIVSTDPIQWVLRPAPLANVARAYGIIVVGESMTPEFEPGDVALVNPHLPPTAGHTYVFYAEGDGEARATIKRLEKVSSGVWHVRQWNPSRGQKSEFTLSRKEWGKCHRVVSKNYK